MERLKKFLKDEEGVTAIEYALIAAVVAVGIAVSVNGVRAWIVSKFNDVAALGPTG